MILAGPHSELVALWGSFSRFRHLLAIFGISWLRYPSLQYCIPTWNLPVSLHRSSSAPRIPPHLNVLLYKDACYIALGPPFN